MNYTKENWPSDKWLQRCKEDEAALKAGKLPNPYHKTELLTIEELIERYGIDQETIDKIKEIQNGRGNTK